MSNSDETARAERRRDARPWFDSILGRYVLAREQAYIDGAIGDIFGFNALQLGLAQYDLLRASRIPMRTTLDSHPPARVRGNFEELPMASQSVDLVLLPHVLEFSRNPHQILREVERVLIPEGHVLITGYNPLSLWGAFHALRRRGSKEYPWRGRFISLPRLKDWLALLNLEVTSGKLGCYVPPLQNGKWLARLQFMEAAGDRWWPLGGGIYFLLAKKRVHSMRLIMPHWRERAAARGTAPVAQNVRRKRQKQTARQRERELV